MSERTRPERQRAMLRAAIARADLTLDELWLRYFGVGGSAGQVELEAYLEDLMPLPAMDRDMLAIAVNERLDELVWPHRVPFANSVREPLPINGPLSALVHLLEAARNSPSEHLPALAANAGRALGVTVSMYLADDDQRRLIPVGRLSDGNPAGAAPGPLVIEGTIAGQAFRDVVTMPSDVHGTVKLWVPLLDDEERLGVLEVTLNSAHELYDPSLRQNCEWLAGLLAQLVAVVTRYGDRLDVARRSRPRTAAADLIWTLVPPTTAAIPGVTVSAAIEPSHDAGGDVYDYALSATTAHFALFDAMGHDLNAGLMAATALASSRAVRRTRGGVSDQADAVDQHISATFSAGVFVTGILAELDVATGELSYLCAGHTPPLLVRQGRVVKRLNGGRRLPFGLGRGGVTPAHENLEPGDWIVLHTDGVTEARDHAGTFFGDQRLTDFLEREAAARHPAPEIVRRLIHAVLDHHHGHLGDDASVVLVEWHPPITL